MSLYEIFKKHDAVSTDTRQIGQNSIFFALKGDKFDGNQYADEAISKGAAFAVIDNAAYKKDERYLLVDDVLTALQDLAEEHRRHLTHLKLIAVVGSNGKTITKELIYKVLNTKYKTFGTEKNWNNHIGVPLNILKLNDKHEFAVIEMGANHLGEHLTLCRIAQPNYGIITNCGKDHLEGYGSIEGVIQSNKELFDYLRSVGGTCFVNANDAILMQISEGLKRFFYQWNSTNREAITGEILNKFPFVTVQVHANTHYGLDKFVINSHLFGSFQLNNILAVTTIGTFFGIDAHLIKSAIEQYVPENNRSQLMKWNENTVLLDAYNANPSSVLPMIEDFMEFEMENKIVILGDMFELGEHTDIEHRGVVERMKNHNFKEVILVGKFFGKHKGIIEATFFDNSEQVKAYLSDKQYKGCYFLAKGSRGMKIESSFGT
ncbi:MAG: UDP-N-acetylmuramoyl-tripeptide--D-alanyl-D-alanine ligase [Cytophagales bacterium]|nr:MAG: UDP-N-acetylmuramoyl-tripeptide--D-alanyl-D-alanine ligase [Cytophagales bacterium]